MRLHRKHLLARWVKERGWTRGAELGVFRGETFFHLLSACPGLTMIGVDIWEHRPDAQTRYAEGGRSYEAFPLDRFEREIRERAMEFPGRAILLKGETVAMADRVADGSLDFAFIDACHEEEGVRADIAAWRPKIRPSGYLAGHDYQASFPGVIRAVQDLCPGFTTHDDSVWSVPV